MMDRPLQVGITGGIGSGKSLVCQIFRCLGVPVYDADSRAKSLMTIDGVLVAQIKHEFGPLSYNPDGTLNRSFISKTTFGNPLRLEQLNSLVHPRVAHDYVQWAGMQTYHKYLLREAALLYESGSYKSVDKMIVVSAPESLKIDRIIARDPQRSHDEILKIIHSQWPEEEKLKRADFIIYNDDHHMVIPQVLELHEKFANGLAIR
jgi:dephospho-CoA kinase